MTNRQFQLLLYTSFISHGLTMGLYLFMWTLVLHNGLQNCRQAQEALQGKSDAPPSLKIPSLPGLPVRTDTFGLMAFGALAMTVVICQIPAGSFSDIFGRRLSLLLSAGCRALFFAAFALVAIAGGRANHNNEELLTWVALVGMVFLGLSASLRVALIPWCTDELNRAGRKAELGRVFGNGRFSEKVAFTVAAMFSVGMYLWGHAEVIFIVGVVVAVATAIILLIVPMETRFRTTTTTQAPTFVHNLRAALEELLIGSRAFFTTYALVLIALADATIWVVINLVDQFWIPFFGHTFPVFQIKSIDEGQGGELTLTALGPWLGLVLTYSLAAAVGAYTFARLRLPEELPAYARSLLWFGTALSLSLIAIATVSLWMGILDQWVAFGVIVFLFVLHKVADGALEPNIDALQGQAILTLGFQNSGGAVLAFIAFFRNIFTALLAFGFAVWVVKDVNPISIWWALSAVAVVMVCVFLRFRLRPADNARLIKQ